MQIDPKTLSEILQLGGQYMLPIAALLRALYSGVRGKLPEGFTQIAAAAAFAFSAMRLPIIWAAATLAPLPEPPSSLRTSASAVDALASTLAPSPEIRLA